MHTAECPVKKFVTTDLPNDPALFDSSHRDGNWVFSIDPHSFSIIIVSAVL